VAPARKFSVVRLGIELEPRVRFDGDPAEVRRRHGIPTEKFVVGWFGRMTAVKRTEDLLTMLTGLRERGIDALLVLVGDGDDRPRLEQRAHDLGIAKSCLFLGYQENVAAWYAVCDAVILSSANEGTPVTIIEALAAGRPVVATKVGGVPDVVDEGETGFLVRMADTHAMAERLEILARDPARREAMGRLGRERVLRRYGVDRLVDDIDALYRELLGLDAAGAASSATSRR
jgi:glycosyltransferase involved in cell wall biosynthesis